MENLVNRYIDGLKSNSDEIRLSTVADLRQFIASDLKESVPSNYAEVIDYLCSELNELLNGNDINEKKGAILAIGKFHFRYSVVYSACWIVRMCNPFSFDLI